jgi:hypothetical protein
MATLESKLVIGAKDETGGAFGAIQKHIAALDRQIATFDKMMTAVGKVAKANDPMIASINASTRALAAQRGAVAELAEGADVAAGAQRTLGEAIMSTTRMMVAQGVEAVKVAGKIVASQKTAAKGAARAREGGPGGMGIIGAGAAAVGGLLVPYAIAEGSAKALEAGANLEQMKFRVRAVSGGDATEGPFAEALAAEIAAKYPAISQAKALDTYLELRGNAANQNGSINQETARRNLTTVSQAQMAALAIGTEITPEDAQNLLKAVEGSGRAGDPTAVGKMFDSYLKAKQVFGSAIDSSKIRDYAQNAKGANFGIGEEQFFWQNIVRMTEGNASRLGNETAQTLQTLVGGHATKQTAKWLVDMGLATGFTPQGGGAATINGLSGSGTLQVNQLDWANQFLLPALQKHGVLSEENIKAREELLRKDNPNIEERALRERAEAGLISSAVARSGMRSTVTDNLAHAIANELLIARDTAQMKGASSSATLAANVGQNPIAAMAELTASISNFGAVVTSPIMKGAASTLDSLARAISAFTGGIAKEEQAQNKGEASPGRSETNRHINRLLFGKDTDESGWDLLKRKFGWGSSDGAPLQLPAAGAPEHHWGPWHAGGSAAGPIITDRPFLGRDPRSPQSGPYSYSPKGAGEVSVSGQATVEQTLTVRIEPSPLLTAIVDQARQQSETLVPLSGGGTGRMDSDAGPHRHGGIGSM